jgi:hypothetical protein
MTRYTAHGKQVLRGSEHIADAADTTWAQIIADALNGERGLYPYQREALRAMRIDPIRVSSYDYASEPDETIHMICHSAREKPAHVWQRQQDEYACSCGARWDVSDGDEHPPTR